MISYLSSSYEGQKIYVRIWPVENEIATVQLVHGMCEYIDRYDDFAKYLNTLGFTVIGHDHLGHGYSVRKKEDLGYFYNAEVENLIKDMKKISDLRSKDVPFYILGHSMGSFLTRIYLEKYHVDKAVLMGTGHMSTFDGKLLYKIASFYESMDGDRYRGKILNKLTTGGYKKMLKSKDPLSWLSKNKENIEKYRIDPLCDYNFTTNGYKMLARIIMKMNEAEKNKKIECPVLFYSGKKDPVGKMGYGVTKVYNEYKKSGIDARIILKEDLRHEVLNENDESVYREIGEFFK